MPALLDELRAIVPHYGASVFFLDAQGQLANIYDENPETPHVAPLYLQEFYNHPEREYGTGFPDALRQRYGVQGFEEIVTVELNEFVRTDYYNLILRELGYSDLIRLAFWDGDVPVGGIMLARAPHERPFSVADRRRLAELSSFFAHALSSRAPRAAPLVESEREGLIVADAEGRIVSASAEGRRLLFLACNPRAHPSDGRGPTVLPPALIALSRTLAEVFADRLVHSAPTYHHRNVWGGFRFSGHRLEGDTSISLIGITVTHQDPLPIRLARVAARLPLTSRQAEVSVLLADGLTDEATAKRMGISSNTVITHRRAIYEKLGVHSRSELVSRMLMH